MDELQSLPEYTEPVITPNSADRFPLLFAESQPCDFPLNAQDTACIDEMHSVLDDLGDEAAGLAAVQIGYPRRIFMLRRNGVNEVFINPVFTNVSTEKVNKNEGCLSLPGMVYRIARPRSVTLEWHNEMLSPQERTFTGFWARAVCHEMDHLNGQLLMEHADSVLQREEPRQFFRHQQGSIVRDAAFDNRVARRRAANKRARKQRARNR